jgi:hypothetical protein
MRGNPILRAVLLALALCLTGALVAAVIGNSRRPVPAADPAPPSTPPASLVPTFVQIILSAHAKSLTFTEPSGRVISVPTNGQPTFFHQAELAIDPSDSSWSATLVIEWTDLALHHFARFDFEPDRLKSSSLTLDFPPGTNTRPLTADFKPSAP